MSASASACCQSGASWRPDGTLSATVHLPCPNITKIAFGGKDLRTAFATTAWKGLSDAERATRAKQIDDKKKQLQRDGEDASNDFQNEMQEMYQGLASKVYDVLSTYAQQHGYTLVLDVAQQQTPVLYSVDSTNITKPIIDAYNVKSGVPAPPQPAAGSAPPPTNVVPAAPKPAPKTPPTSH